MRDVHIGHAEAHRRVGQAGHEHRAAHRLADRIEARPVAVRTAGAVGGDGGQHDARVQRRQRGVVQPQLAQRGRRQVGDHHVGARDQLAHDAPAGVAGQVQRQAALVAVHLQVQAAFAGVGHAAARSGPRRLRRARCGSRRRPGRRAARRSRGRR